MDVRRLGWAGLELRSAGETLLIDLLEDISPLSSFVGEARTPLPAPAEPKALGALVTHLHLDHCDPPALAEALGGGAPIIRPEPAAGSELDLVATAWAEAGLTERRLPAGILGDWETVQLGPFIVTAVPAVDGFGDPQVSWVVEADDRRIFHGGDTIFHGAWWSIAGRLGPFDAVFLPCNGARCDFPHRQPPTQLVSCMDPLQAATAAHVLGGDLAVPIHYDTLHAPPVYAQVDDPSGAFTAAAGAFGVNARVVAPGGAVEWVRRTAKTR